LLNSLPNRADEAKAEFDEARALDPKLSAPGESAEASPAGGGVPSLATEVTPAAPAAAETAASGAASGTAPAAGASIASAGGVQAKIKPLNKLFLLTKNSPVYQGPDQTSAVVAQVRSKKYVHVTGIAGDYLQIRLKNGTIGFIPVAAAE